MTSKMIVYYTVVLFYIFDDKPVCTAFSEVLFDVVGTEMHEQDQCQNAITNTADPCGQPLEVKMSAGNVSMRVGGKLVSSQQKIENTENASSRLIEIKSCVDIDTKCEDKDNPLCKNESKWIGVVHIPDYEYKKSTCYYFDKLKAAVLLGASALLILTVNQKVVRQLEAKEYFSIPVVVISGRNASSLLILLRRNFKLSTKISVNWHKEENEDEENEQINSQLTFWGTCGRPVGWGGLICFHPEDTGEELTYIHCIGNSLVFISTVTLLVLMKTVVSNWLQKYWSLRDEESFRVAASRLLDQMQIKIFRRKKKKKDQNRCPSASCAICLDDFINKQILRVLPCGHEYHQYCVDPWLLRKSSCPLCKRNFLRMDAN